VTQRKVCARFSRVDEGLYSGKRDSSLFVIGSFSWKQEDVVLIEIESAGRVTDRPNAVGGYGRLLRKKETRFATQNGFWLSFEGI